MIKVPLINISTALILGAVIFSGCSTVNPSLPPGAETTDRLVNYPAPEIVDSPGRKSHPLKIVDCPSPNFNDRTSPVSILMFHYTAGEAKGSLATLTSAKSKHPVSAHYMVDRDGTVYRLVDESKRAWHAGPGHWQGKGDINSASIGIEIVNLGKRSDGTFDPYPEAQLQALETLSRGIMQRHRIRWVLGHSDTNLAHKIDPGEHFPWKRFASLGIGLWTDDLIRPTLSDDEMLAAIGYDTSDVPLALKCFQRHFYPVALTAGGTCTRARLAAVHQLVTAAP